MSYRHPDHMHSPRNNTMRQKILILLILGALCSITESVSYTLDPSDVELQLGEELDITVHASEKVDHEILLCIQPEQLNGTDLILAFPESIINSECLELKKGDCRGLIHIEATQVGSSVFHLFSSDSQEDRLDAKVKVAVVHSKAASVTGSVIGWIYFLAWSVSFYPQAILNFQRKSVIGLNFDFVCYNIIGFCAYSAFNVALYFIPSIQAAYLALHPDGVIHVQLNDVFFAVHATLITAITLLQCFIYERGGQSVSKMCIGLCSASMLFVLITLILSFVDVLSWLNFIYFLSYIKLGVTLIKYIPQVYMNYERKSTAGWSIYMILMDLVGGLFSILQMFILAGNNDDWASIFGDITKFGLGLFSVFFDLIFIVQHYCLYKEPTEIYELKHDLDYPKYEAEDVKASPV